MPHPIERPRLAASVVVLLLGFFVPQTVAAAADWVVIAPAGYAAEFAPLAAHRIAEGMTAEVVTLESIWAQDLAGGDAPARLREYLRGLRDGGTRYVLLGGDASAIPARDVILTAGYGDLPGQSDLYLVCFDQEWDADGDGVYDEFPSSLDLTPALAIGRAPVRNASGARVFVAKTIAFAQDAGEPYRRRVMFMDTVMIPYPWLPGQPVQQDMAADVDMFFVPLFTDSPLGFETVRLYQNHADYPDALPLSSEAALAQLGSGGIGLVQVSCHASAGLWDLGFDGKTFDLLSGDDLKGLDTQGHGFFVGATAPESAAHGETESLLATSLRDPSGGCVGVAGFAGAVFYAPGMALQEGFWTAALATSPRAGDAWAAALVAYPNTHRWSAVVFALLGDPALAVVPPGGSRVAATDVVLQAVPNPFNPATRLAFELTEAGWVKLEIFDVAGRRVTTLADGFLPAGAHERLWQGRGDTGGVAAGVYLARLATPAGMTTKRLVLLK